MSNPPGNGSGARSEFFLLLHLHYLDLTITTSERIKSGNDAAGWEIGKKVSPIRVLFQHRIAHRQQLHPGCSHPQSLPGNRLGLRFLPRWNVFAFHRAYGVFLIDAPESCLGGHIRNLQDPDNFVVKTL